MDQILLDSSATENHENFKACSVGDKLRRISAEFGKGNLKKLESDNKVSPLVNAMQCGFGGVQHGFGHGGGYRYYAYHIYLIKIYITLNSPPVISPDPNLVKQKTREKDQIKELNNQFATLIEKVRFLEQQNKVLKVKWSLLQQQPIKKPGSTSEIKGLFSVYIVRIKKHLDTVNNHIFCLELELENERNRVEEFKHRYEKEMKVRSDAEKKILIVKQNANAAYKRQEDLRTKVTLLKDKIHFFRTYYEMKLNELKRRANEIKVILKTYNSSLNLDGIIAEVKAQYEGLAKMSRAELEEAFKIECEHMQKTAKQKDEDIEKQNMEMIKLEKEIKKIRIKSDKVKSQIDEVKNNIAKKNSEGQHALLDAHQKKESLGKTLEESKKALAEQLKTYHTLMNVKLTLDMEIATYKALLDGEDDRVTELKIVGLPAFKMIKYKDPEVLPKKISPKKKIIDSDDDEVVSRDGHGEYNFAQYKEEYYQQDFTAEDLESSSSDDY